jgi:glycosyltransferase involved in cell wall biosynthesis
MHANRLEKKSEVIYNPIPNIDYIPLNADNIGYFGGENPLKGFNTLISAWFNINKKYDNKLYITNLQNNNKYKYLINHNIIPFSRLKGHKFNLIYKKIRGVLVPSIIREALPYIIIESLLKGRVVIASHIGGIPEITDGMSGCLLTNPGDSYDLALKIEQLLAYNRECLIDAGIKNREKILQRFDNQKIIERFIKILSNIK